MTRAAWRPRVVLCALLTLWACGDPSGPAGAVPAEWTALSAGDYHTCAIAGDGAAYCWGSNEFGQLGSDERSLERWPRRVAGSRSFVAITSGFGHSCALTHEGEAYCWGLGDEGQLGNGSRDDASRPTPIAGSWRLSQISAGHSHTCGVTFEGEGVCWGDNSYGQLGTGSLEPSRVPVRVSDGGVRFFEVGAGHTHSCGAGVSGITYCWGDNRRAQLGTGSFRPTRLPTSVRTDHTFILIRAGYETSCGLTANGAPYCWGSNDAGRLAAPADVEVSGNPRAVPAGVPYNDLSVGPGAHVCGITWSGVLLCWGEGGAGQLGDGGSRDSAVPVVADVPALFVRVSTGLRHSCALTTTGAIYCWGGGGSGQLGDGGHEERSTPAIVGPGT